MAEKRNRTKPDQPSNLPATSQQLVAIEGPKEGSNVAGGGIPIPSDASFARRYLRVLTRRLMLVCAFLIVLCLVAVPVLSGRSVKQITVEGCSYYDAQYLIDQSGVSVGDKLFDCSPGDIQAKLLDACPYLRSASVERHWNGCISIRVSERTAQWALTISSTEVAILDEAMRVLEICSRSEIAIHLCVVSFELYVQGAEQVDKPPVGTTYQGNPTALERLDSISNVVSSRGTSGLRILDMTDPYNVLLTFDDGDVYALGDCSSPDEQIAKAMDAEKAYRQKTGESAPLWVGVDSLLQTIIRPLSQNDR